jgi:hypothetical protein
MRVAAIVSSRTLWLAMAKCALLQKATGLRDIASHPEAGVNVWANVPGSHRARLGTEGMAVTCVAVKVPLTCLFPPPLVSLRLVEWWMCQHPAANPHALMMVGIVACGPAGASR